MTFVLIVRAALYVQVVLMSPDTLLFLFRAGSLHIGAEKRAWKDLR